MNRPIGVTLLARGRIGRDLRPLAPAVFMGWVNWTFIGKRCRFPDPQWGQVVWSRHPRRDLVLGRRRVLEHPGVRLVVRDLHQPLHPDLRVLRDPRFRDPRRRVRRDVHRAPHLHVPQLPGGPAAVRRARDVAHDARTAGRGRPDAGGAGAMLPHSRGCRAPPRHSAPARLRRRLRPRGSPLTLARETDPRPGVGLVRVRTAGDRGRPGGRDAARGAASVGGVEPFDVRFGAEPRPLAAGEGGVPPGVERRSRLRGRDPRRGPPTPPDSRSPRRPAGRIESLAERSCLVDQPGVELGPRARRRSAPVRRRLDLESEPRDRPR